MKKIFGYFAACILAAGLIGCSDDDAENTSGGNLDGVYFSSEAVTEYTVTSEMSSVVLDVLRSDNTTSISVPVSLTAADPDYADLFTGPAEVNFAAGVSKIAYTVSFDRASLESGATYDLTLEIADETLQVPFGISALVLKLKVPEPWKSLGTGLFSDPFLFDDTYSVEIQQHELQPTRFRVVAPYNEGLVREEYYESAAETENASEYLEFTLMQPGNKLNDTNITRDDLIYFTPTNTGFLNPSYGEFIELYHPSAFMNFQTEASWAYSKVLEWQDDAKTLPAIVQLAPYYYMSGIGGWNYTTAEGDDAVRIVFPGVTVADLSLDAAYAGFRVDADNTTAYPAFDLAYGADVASISYALVAGDISRDYADIAAGIANGSIASTTAAVSGAGQEQFVSKQAYASGVYTVVIVPAGADGELQAASAIAVSFYFAGVGASEVPDVDIDVWVFPFSYLFPGYESVYPDSTTFLWYAEGSEISEWKALVATTEEIDKLISLGNSAEALVLSYGEDLDLDYINEDGYDYYYYPDCDPDTSYTVILYAKNIYGKTAVVSASGKTAAEAAAAAAAKLSNKHNFPTAPTFSMTRQHTLR